MAGTVPLQVKKDPVRVFFFVCASRNLGEDGAHRAAYAHRWPDEGGHNRNNPVNEPWWRDPD